MNSHTLVLQKYQLYETRSRFYIIGSNQSETQYKVLKIDRSEHHTLNVVEDGAIYSKAEISELVAMIENGNRSAGGLVCSMPLFYGIAGFTRFTAGWYLVLIKRKSAVALVGGHYLYHCEETVIVPIDAKPDKSAEEMRLLNAFQQVNLSKNFYFSYTYDLTNTLQRNLTHVKADTVAETSASGAARNGPPSAWGFNDKFVWNWHLLQSAFANPNEASAWVLPLVHGFCDQAKLSVFGRTVYVTLIGRRSRHFAGARFLKRGINDEGFVANDVETEQIVSEALTTPFYAPLPRWESEGPEEPHRRDRRISPRYTSYVQHRGSIPVYWSQDATGMQAKPPINVGVIDPFFSAAALHFDDLFGRYATPIIVLNLIKTKESAPRESKLLPELTECIDYLNQTLPEDKKIQYIGFDIATANKKHNVDVIARLEDEAQKVLELTGIFHSGSHPLAYGDDQDVNEDTLRYRSSMALQTGVCRTNCIDCLDRTNAAQFIIGRTAFGRQLHALGILKDAVVPFDSAAADLLTGMYHDHGDTIAIQYGGSVLANTIESYKMKEWKSRSRDMLAGISRYYANSFSDADKQVAINLFLGMQTVGIPLTARPSNRSYVQWYTPSYIDQTPNAEVAQRSACEQVQEDDAYWIDYYKPNLLTDLKLHFAFTLHGNLAYTHLHHGADAMLFSPFKTRLGPVALRDSRRSKPASTGGSLGVRKWMSGKKALPAARDVSAKPVMQADEEKPAPGPVAWTSEALGSRHLQPSVSTALAAEYEDYVQQSIIVSEQDVKIYENSQHLSEHIHKSSPLPHATRQMLLEHSSLSRIVAHQLGHTTIPA